MQLNGSLGLRGWQWLFLVEGIPALLLGLITFRFLTDRPSGAAWLTADERNWLSQAVCGNRPPSKARAAAAPGVP